MRKFEIVKDDKRRTNGDITLPKRGTKSSVGYDFYANANYTVYPNEIAKVWTDVKAQFNHGEALLLNVRSSMGGKFMLANTQGWVEPDYYGNEDNDGNIGIFLKNISEQILEIKRGDKIAQGMFVQCLFTDDDECNITRKGGFGSTDKE